MFLNDTCAVIALAIVVAVMVVVATAALMTVSSYADAFTSQQPRFYRTLGGNLAGRSALGLDLL
jgi:ABC-type transport system involved in cytochrome bd biosynthesis fused ATPase/permease subunit